MVLGFVSREWDLKDVTHRFFLAAEVQNCSITVKCVFITLRAKLSGAVYDCIVIGPVCGFVCVTMITRNCVHQSSPGRGSAVRQKCLALPYYSQRAVFASLRALFYTAR